MASDIYVVKRSDGLWSAKTPGRDDDTAAYPTAADALGTFVRDRPDEFQLFALSPSVDNKTLGKLFYENVVRKGLAKITVIRMDGMNISIKSSDLSPDASLAAEFGA